jgi:hypothetical protein
LRAGVDGAIAGGAGREAAEKIRLAELLRETQAAGCDRGAETAQLHLRPCTKGQRTGLTWTMTFCPPEKSSEPGTPVTPYRLRSSKRITAYLYSIAPLVAAIA